MKPQIKSDYYDSLSNSILHKSFQHFFKGYKAILLGGEYRNTENRLIFIEPEDSLGTAISGVENQRDKQLIIEIIFIRFLFTRFIQFKRNIIPNLLTEKGQKIHELSHFKIKNLLCSEIYPLFLKKSKTTESISCNRDLIDKLFYEFEVEKRNSSYKIKSASIRLSFEFLNSYNYTLDRKVYHQYLVNPDVLGYIFEKNLISEKRKEAGIYYTPQKISKLISEKTINSYIVSMMNQSVSKLNNKPIQDIEDIYKHDKDVLEILWNIISELRICDIACGSGAFLVTSADILINFQKNLKKIIKIETSEYSLRREIVKKNLYGIDINPIAIQITKFRLWLWLLASNSTCSKYNFPNLNSNICEGNSLIGFSDLTDFNQAKSLLDSPIINEPNINILKLFEEKTKTVRIGKETSMFQTENLNNKINKLYLNFKKQSDQRFYNKFVKSNKNKLQFEDFLTKMKPFHWFIEFKDKFDIILLNPPYIKTEKISKTELSILKSLNYNTAKNQFDNFSLFVERAIRDTLRWHGNFGIIIPSLFLKGYQHLPLREFLLTNTMIQHVIDLGDDVFPDVELPIVIIIGQKTKKFKPVSKIKFIRKSVAENELKSYIIEQQSWMKDPEKLFIFANQTDIQILTKLSNNTVKLGEISSSSRGLEFGKQQHGITENKSKLTDLDLLTGDHIDRYKISGNVYISRELLLAKPKSLSLFSNVKLLIRETGNRITAVYDESGLYFLRTLIVIQNTSNKAMNSLSNKKHLKFLLAIINSSLIQFFYLIRYKQNSKTFPKIRINQLRNIPIKRIDNSNKQLTEEISNCVNTILTSNSKKDYDKLDNRIDELVFELYELNDKKEYILSYLKTN